MTKRIQESRLLVDNSSNRNNNKSLFVTVHVDVLFFTDETQFKRLDCQEIPDKERASGYPITFLLAVCVVGHFDTMFKST